MENEEIRGYREGGGGRLEKGERATEGRKKKINFKHRPYFRKQLMPENRRHVV